jgi:ankyrin repeat protein
MQYLQDPEAIDHLQQVLAGPELTSELVMVLLGYFASKLDLDVLRGIVLDKLLAMQCRSVAAAEWLLDRVAPGSANAIGFDSSTWTVLHVVAAMALGVMPRQEQLVAVRALLAREEYCRQQNELEALPLVELRLVHETAVTSLFQQIVKLDDNLEAKNGARKTPLALAASLGNAVGCKVLIAIGAAHGRVPAQQADKDTALVQALQRHDYYQFSILLAQGANGEQELSRGGRKLFRPVHWAAAVVSLVGLRALLASGVDVMARDSTGSTPLHILARCGKVSSGTDDVGAAVELLIAGGVDKDATDEHRRTPLLCAAGSGYVALVEALLKAGSKTDVQDDTGHTPLHGAAMSNSSACISALLDAGSDVDARNSVGSTPLHYAAYAGSEACVAVLLNAGPKTDVQDDTGHTPLHDAAMSNNSACISALLDAGSDVDARDSVGCTPLHSAAARGFDSCVAVLLKASAQQEAKDYKGWTPLHWAAKRNRCSCIKLLTAGSDIEAVDSLGRTPLHLAARRGFVACVDVLLQAGANKEARTRPVGLTPLHYAAFFIDRVAKERQCQVGGVTSETANNLTTSDDEKHNQAILSRIDTLRLLLMHRVDVNATDARGRTALHGLSRTTSEKSTFRMLIGAGAAIDTPDRDGYTPLHHIVRWNTAEVLLQVPLKSIHKHSPGPFGRTLLHIAAAFRNDMQVLKGLIGAGVNLQAVDFDGLTALHHAAFCNGESTVRLLLDAAAGLNIHAVDAQGRTALHYAVVNSLPGVVNVLLGAGMHSNIADASGRTALHYLMCVSHANKASVLSELVDAGVNVDAVDANGCSALDYAIEVRDDVVEAQLRAHHAIRAIHLLPALTVCLPAIPEVRW